MSSTGDPISRRAFFRTAGALGIAGAALGQTGSELGGVDGGELELSTLTQAHFGPLVGSRFELRGDDGSQVVARLRLVRRLPEPSVAGVGRARPFGLIFRTRRDEALVQQTYRVHHHSLGSFTAFLVPVGRSDAETRLEAIFA